MKKITDIVVFNLGVRRHRYIGRFFLYNNEYKEIDPVIVVYYI